MTSQKKIIEVFSIFFTVFGIIYFFLALFHNNYGIDTGLLAMILGEVIDKD